MRHMASGKNCYSACDNFSACSRNMYSVVITSELLNIFLLNNFRNILFSIFYCHLKTVVYCFSPHETPFEDGTFKLTMEFTEEYPNKPPTVRFVSKMFHPNG